MLEERSLWSAVMENAILDIQKYRNYKKTGRGVLKMKELRRHSDSSLYWLKNKGDVSVCSFNWVCDVLIIDPDKTRRRILNNIDTISFVEEG